MMLKSDSDYLVKTKMFCGKALHFCLTVVLFYIVWLNFRYNEYPQVKDVGFRYNYLVTAGFAALLAFFNRTYNSYLFGYSQIRTLTLAQFLSQLFSVGIIYFAVSLGWNHFENPALFFLLVLGYIILDVCFSFVGNGVYFHLNPSRKTILIYRNKQDRRRFGSIKGKPTEKLYTIVKEIQFDGSFDELRDKITGYDITKRHCLKRRFVLTDKILCVRITMRYASRRWRIAIYCATVMVERPVSSLLIL